MYIDTSDIVHFKNSIFNAIVAPRPIGWISTVSGSGVCNLAPFSYFNGISATPPMVMFAANAPEDRDEKDTLANVRATGEFVVNFVSWAHREAMNRTSAPVRHGVDEFEVAGLAKEPSAKVKPPRVAGAPAHLECAMLRIVDFPPQAPGERTSSVVFGRVVAVHIAEEFLDANGRFDTPGARPIARLGGFSYATLGEIFEMRRPTAAEAMPVGDGLSHL
jgi:flavin reductase (DIM6/NTAB) family NADH-FMN oxidoreductase RutF